MSSSNGQVSLWVLMSNGFFPDSLTRSFNDDLDKLASIPILPALTQNAAKPFHAFDDALGDNNNSFSKQTKSNESTVSHGSNNSGSSSRKAVSVTIGGGGGRGG